MQGENSLSPPQKGQNFGGPFMEGGVCSPETWISVFGLPEGRSGWGLQGKFGVSLAASAPRPTPQPPCQPLLQTAQGSHLRQEKPVLPVAPQASPPSTQSHLHP